MSDFSGIWVALVTPFKADASFSVDHAALRRLVEHYRAAGVAGVVALGSTGEAAALDEGEQDAVLDCVLAAAGKLPVMCGLAGNNTTRLHARLARLNQLPLAAVLCPAPYYVRPSQAALVAHFHELAERSRAPLVLYDIPYRTGVALATDTLLTLAAHPNIRAVKDCGGSAEKTRALIVDGRLQVLAGEDAQIFPTLCLGGAGAISAAAHLLPERFVAMQRAVAAERLAEARALHHALVPLIEALFAEPNPCIIKAMLARQALLEDVLRPPLLRAGDEALARAARVLAALF
ncbi:4-hydroxy-tetrahydrodipicolinate synthase [Azoarcus indigens]|uniref:4-hydroxy-tetrahydrodipicolinate synthase n=1 Tax=Azoarcus indigens TaxID=29545 RepID=A0A4R6DVY0_9RHOO|nr:4-hydroxy-tetrahydrodipicolinate synthase [Azoarcus indigens]NMG65029.1 4-hydroxy-tetrahydrodipicolinate synthase [Azoarcus indigens]TDN48924.1 4-hydroxy-tetrahydrodipicolinate synthase [Azoarcus indigens]